MERVKGIEPSYAAWEAAVLPLNYTRLRHAEPFEAARIDMRDRLRL
jgi:hypothetical protein